MPSLDYIKILNKTQKKKKNIGKRQPTNKHKVNKIKYKIKKIKL